MQKYVAHHNGRIIIISEGKIESAHLTITELPLELNSISEQELILNFKIINGFFVDTTKSKSRRQLKVALVSNWKMHCGIATYAEELYQHLIGEVKDFKLFVEENENPTQDLNIVGDKMIGQEQVVACWKRGEPLQKLVEAIKEYDPDIVWIQHEFGLFPNARYWLSLMTQLSKYRVITTMHSVFYHQDKTICEAAMPEIVVHLPGAKQLLEEVKQVSGKVYVIPHGCTPPMAQSRLWNFYKSDHTFIQLGFGFPYKGWENSLKTTAILKLQYPDVFFTGLISESPFNKLGHQLYYEELMEMVDKLDIQNNVALIRGYQSDATLDSYFRTNKVALFPYVSQPGHEVFGASGAARLTMARQIPVITSNVNHFSDLPTIKAEGPEAMALALDRIFSNSELAKAQVEKQNRFLIETSWKRMADKYLELFENGPRPDDL